MKEWAAIDIADALELLSPDFKNHEVRAHAVATLQVSSSWQSLPWLQHSAACIMLLCQQLLNLSPPCTVVLGKHDKLLRGSWQCKANCACHFCCPPSPPSAPVLLQRKEDDELLYYLLQLVQALRFEAQDNSRLARFLVNRATHNPAFATFLHW